MLRCVAIVRPLLKTTRNTEYGASGAKGEIGGGNEVVKWGVLSGSCELIWF